MAEEEEIDIIDIIKKLWRNRKLIMIVTAFFMIIGIAYALLATPYYQSSLTMYAANGESNKGGSLSSMAAMMGIGGGSTSSSYNISDVVKSKKIARELVLNKWNTKKYSVKKNLIEYWQMEGENDDLIIFSAIEKCRNMISLSTDKETGLMKLSILSTDPVLSAEMANYLGEAVTRHIQQHYGESVENNLEHINTRLIQVEEDLKTKELALKNYKETNRDGNSARSQLEVARLMREVEIKQGVYLTLNQEKELAMIEKVKTKPVINILDKADVPFRKAKPSGLMICIVFSFLGGILGVALVLFLPYLAENFGEFRLARLVK